MTKVSLLVADDEHIVRAFIKKVVEEDKLPVSTIFEASNGREAMQIAMEQCLDVHLLDIRMPVMDGLQVAKNIIEKCPNAYIVIVTAYDVFDYARSALRIGVADYLLKPINKEAVVRIINSALERKKQLLNKSHKQIEVALLPMESQSNPIISKIEKYIRSNLNTELHLDDIAKAVFMSPAYCSRQFKKLSGQPLSAFIAGAKLEKARELLETTYLNITEITEMIGFSNNAYFSAWFKKHTGEAPLRYRRKNMRRQDVEL